MQKDYKEQDQKELEKKTKEYAKEVYAQFALGEAYNLCKPYSYESLKMDMEAENQQRQAKKSAGEVVYGTLEYTLDSYLEYTLSNLKIQTVDYMVRNHEESLEKEAKTYWEAHPDKFERVDEITYRLGEETKKLSGMNFPHWKRQIVNCLNICIMGKRVISSHYRRGTNQSVERF